MVPQWRPRCSCSRQRQSPCSSQSGRPEPSAPYPGHQILRKKQRDKKKNLHLAKRSVRIRQNSYGSEKLRVSRSQQ
jgi:hypothetical protein